ncbi:MAG: hypothetical protein ACLFQV_12795 [Vulcanimicrobiota bacterium]
MAAPLETQILRQEFASAAREKKTVTKLVMVFYYVGYPPYISSMFSFLPIARASCWRVFKVGLLLCRSTF